MLGNRWWTPVLAWVPTIAGACGGSVPEECTQVVAPSADDYDAIQTALIDVEPGGVICLERGTYHITDELSLFVPGVTLRGATGDPDDVVLDFAPQVTGANGLSVKADAFTIQDLTVKNTRGDGIRVDSADRVVFRHLKVRWDAGPTTENGAYALYPVSCDHVIVEDCDVSGASDAGIYVGQSRHVIVRRNHVHQNVAGIEIENTTFAEVYDNHAHDNTAGILVFNLPNLPVKDGRKTRVYRNLIEENNRENFAAAGTIVSIVPRGVGIVVMAADETEIHDNVIRENVGTGAFLLSYRSLQMPATSDGYDPYPETIWLHHNRFADNGGAPQDVLVALGQDRLEDILWDGYRKDDDPARRICLSDNGAATFRMFDAPGGFDRQSTDMTPHLCMHAPLAPVTF